MQQSARHRGSSALVCTHSSQTAHPSCDPRWSHRWSSAEATLAAVIDRGLSTYFNALDDEDKATAKLYVQKAAQAADEARQQTVGGLRGSGVTSPTVSAFEHPNSAYQDEDSEDMDFSAPSRLTSPLLPQLSVH